MSDQESSQLKALEQKAKRANDELNRNQEVIDEYMQKRKKCEKQLASIQNEIRKLKRNSDGLVVSEHAMIRYLERKMDVSPKDIKDVILTDQLKTTYKALGDGVHPTGTGIRAVIKNGVVVTMK